MKIHFLFFLAPLLPYATLFYKKISISIRLLFACLFEIIIFYLLFLILYAVNSLDIVGYFYEMFFIIPILLNLFLILFIWVDKKLIKKAM
ncbi:hypothetical protein BH11BAC5_BH11BAC5_01920 [soil metagenome]|jgi:hypothetical protein